MERVLSKVDAAPRAFHRPSAADPLAVAPLAAYRTPERRVAGAVASAAVFDALFGVHAGAVAVGEARIASDAAAAGAHGLGVRGRRARRFAAAAMLRVGFRIDADTGAVE